MSISTFSHNLILQHAVFNSDDKQQIAQRRGQHNQLGFAYQLAFVRIAFRFPIQNPLEIVEELLVYVSININIEKNVITLYKQHRETIIAHRRVITGYLKLNSFDKAMLPKVEQYLFEEACRLEQTGALLNQAKLFLRNANTLLPADDTLQRIIITQRQAARTHIYTRIDALLSTPLKTHLDEWLLVDESGRSPLFRLKQPPSRPTPKGMLRLADNLKAIELSGLLALDLSWLNNNYQRMLAHYANRYPVDRIAQFIPPRRYAILVCFLRQTYCDTIDHMLDMYHKMLTIVYNRAQDDVDKHNRQQRQQIRAALTSFSILTRLLLNEDIADSDLRRLTFDEIERAKLVEQVATIDEWLTSRYRHPFNCVVQRFPYLRQFSPALFSRLVIHSDNESQRTLLDGIALLQEMNATKQRHLPSDPPLDFIPKKLRPFVIEDGKVHRSAWECALLLAVRDEIRSGNLYVQDSRHFGRFDNFFIATDIWKQRRNQFFQRANLPVDANAVAEHLTQHLNQAYDHFLAGLPDNQYAKIEDDQWQLSVDVAEKLTPTDQKSLLDLKKWLRKHLRHIRLPELLIEVDNELQFSQHFLLPSQSRLSADICPVIATIMAHGCNVGPFTMAQLTQNVTYTQIKQITDWQMTEDAQRQALALVVNGISQLPMTQNWGEGKTSSSDGQRFRFQRKVLQQTWSNRFNDYALEFYAFIADNYAPFYSTVIECNERDAAYVLDGLLYNESDLAIEEHYTDTHGYTEINFAAFAMLGRRFSPRIRGIQKQRIYRIDTERDYGALLPLLERKDRTIGLDGICEHWDRMGHFYASLECGHVTASSALKQLVRFSGKNDFYRANRDLGRIFKTVHILRVLSDPLVRKNMQHGLLKEERLHALARQVAYGKQGTIGARDWQGQKTTASCLTLIIACIIYWQAKEIERVITECAPEEAEIDLAMISHISPIGWRNIILYGEYIFDPKWVRP